MAIAIMARTATAATTISTITPGEMAEEVDEVPLAERVTS